jgi:hypothetical protein
VHENVFTKFPNADVSGFIVWIPILDKDNLAAAFPSAKFLNDSRVQHFYDTNKLVGKAIADSVEWQGNIAWDIYLFYISSMRWNDLPPNPKYWMHQLNDDWATKEKYRTGENLKNQLFISMKQLLVS